MLFSKKGLLRKGEKFQLRDQRKSMSCSLQINAPIKENNSAHLYGVVSVSPSLIDNILVNSIPIYSLIYLFIYKGQVNDSNLEVS